MTGGVGNGDLAGWLIGVAHLALTHESRSHRFPPHSYDLASSSLARVFLTNHLIGVTPKRPSRPRQG